jgi:hypothetical protein
MKEIGFVRRASWVFVAPFRGRAASRRTGLLPEATPLGDRLRLGSFARGFRAVFMI